MSNSLSQLLEPYGSPEQVVDLREETPAGIPYANLLQGDRGDLPDGVVESRAEPLAYVVDGVNRSAEIDLARLRKTVALRGDAPYWVIVEPGRIVVYDTVPGEESPLPLEEVTPDDDRARLVFPRLNAALSVPDKAGRFMYDLLFGLLDQAICELEQRVNRDDAISLVGRALFMRFLIDREIVTAEHVQEICPTAGTLVQLFTGPGRTLATCQWLNRTFNGDFLPLSFLNSHSKMPQDAFAPLEDLMYRSLGGQLRFDWASIDFAHVPVGLLSQVYERQAEMWDPTGKRRQGVYYTPRRIADFMVKEIFSVLEEQGPVSPHQARVLDPAVGGGVFLVSAFQEIVAAWWRYYGSPPDTRELRSILYEQLSGFDISEPALQLAALSLYLKAIELDRDPHPPAKLKFKALRGSVLHSMRGPGEERAEVVLGSLGPKGGDLHSHRYDIVIGNPPWTAIEKKWGKIHDGMVQAVRPIVADRLGPEEAASFTLPDRVPDLPFVWRALEWAKHAGWIALALHGRLLFKTSEGGRDARESLFRAIEVTGLVNGADLRQTPVWPGVEAPFCLLFARNQLPKSNHAFHFVSPYLEEHLNRQGRIRLDSSAAHPVELSRLIAQPELLKTLFRGSALDVALLNGVKREKWPTLKDYFCCKKLATGQGYQVANREREVPRSLWGKPDLRAGWDGPIRIEAGGLPTFRETHLQWPRRPRIYQGPLVLVREALPSKREEGRALCCFTDLVYSRSYYGYSAFGHQDAETLVRYLALLIHSDFFSWHALVTSSRFGVERDALLKEDIDEFPLRPLEDLSEDLKEEVRQLSELLFRNDASLWPDLDAWAARVYGLNRWDQEVIRDTLSVALPFHGAQKRAQHPPSRREVKEFAARIEHELRPFAKARGKSLIVRPLPESSDGAPWETLLLTTSEAIETPYRHTLEDLFHMADREGASQVRLVQPKSELMLLGILREYRYWTPTRARLTALEILGEHLDALLGS